MLLDNNTRMITYLASALCNGCDLCGRGCVVYFLNSEYLMLTLESLKGSGTDSTTYFLCFCILYTSFWEKISQLI